MRGSRFISELTKIVIGFLMLSAVTLNCRRMGADKLARAVVGARISETNEGYFVHCPTETTPRGPLKSRHEAEKYVCPTH